MSKLNDREEAFEKKYAHDQEIGFKVNARAYKILAVWAAGLMGLDGKEADSYAKTTVAQDLNETGMEKIKSKILADLNAKGIKISAHMIDRQMEKSLAEAKTEIMGSKH